MTALYDNIIGVAVLPDLDRPVLSKVVYAIGFTAYRDPHLVTGLAGI